MKTIFMNKLSNMELTSFSFNKKERPLIIFKFFFLLARFICETMKNYIFLVLSLELDAVRHTDMAKQESTFTRVP